MGGGNCERHGGGVRARELSPLRPGENGEKLEDVPWPVGPEMCVRWARVEGWGCDSSYEGGSMII